MIIRAARDCGSASSSQVALSRDLRVDCSGRTFLTYYYGIGGAKFSEKIGFLPEFEWIGCAVRALALSKGAHSRRSRPSVKRKMTVLYQGRTLIFQGRNPLGECLVSWEINHESAFVPQLRDYGATRGHE